MPFFLKLYLLTVPVFFAIDLLWLGLIAKSFYAKHIGFLLSPTPNWTAAILFYLLFIVGILVFATLPALKDNMPLKALALGAFFGLCTYATYDLTNLATVKNWPVLVTVVDLIWGSVISAAVAYISYFIGKRLG